MSAPPRSAFRISRRWRSPTGSVPAIASGSSARSSSRSSRARSSRTDRAVTAQHCTAFAAEQQVLEDAEGFDQHEILVHHADPGGDRVLWGTEANRAAVDPDLPGIGREMPVKQRHQGRLAGAVFANDPVHGAARDGEVDPVTSADRPEAFVDPVALDGGRCARLPHGSARRIRPAMISARAASAFSCISGVTNALLFSSIA